MLRELLALIVVILIIILLFRIIKKFFIFIISSVIGMFALFGFNYLFYADVAVNFWSVIITAIGGIIGFIIVVGMHYLGWAF